MTGRSVIPGLAMIYWTSTARPPSLEGSSIACVVQGILVAVGGLNSVVVRRADPVIILFRPPSMLVLINPRG